jgi:circadian clock protein KaiB
MRKAMPQKLKNSLKEFEKALEQRTDKKFVLKLYITGASRRSSRAVENIRKFCEEYLKDRYELEVIDIYQQPELLEREQVVAAPTLIRKLPPPLRRLIGDMSDTEKILIGLDLKTKEDEKKKHESSQKTGRRKTGTRPRKRD